eukprot:TRINITY_DN4783_c1_g1_i1.p1 TRINITY_DN4783_c1_g1~~TRINITY_DN4783_c1_g1_i1.p1  ORF type:complete len:445 (-),score=51.11 TRINITY_DN4783_c1_g1_i1:287-1621(-)
MQPSQGHYVPLLRGGSCRGVSSTNQLGVIGTFPPGGPQRLQLPGRRINWEAVAVGVTAAVSCVVGRRQHSAAAPRSRCATLPRKDAGWHPPESQSQEVSDIEVELPKLAARLRSDEFREGQKLSSQLRLADSIFRVSPVIIAGVFVLAYGAFPTLALNVADFSFMEVDDLSFETGRPVADQVLISVVVPGLGILFATLASSTLSVLRMRQQEMRKLLRQESILLSTVVMPVRKLFMDNRAKKIQALRQLEKYALCVIGDISGLLFDNGFSTRLSFFNIKRACTAEMLRLIGSVDYDLLSQSTPEVGHSLTRAVVLGRVIQYSQGLVNQLDQRRAARRATLTFTFPALHWIVLFTLAAALPLAALLLASTYKSTSPQIFGDPLVRLLFGFLGASISALLLLLADLNEPYAGYVQIEEDEGFGEFARALRAEIESLESGPSPDKKG